MEPINVLGDDELHLAQLHEAGQGHVGPRRPRLVPTHVHVRLETPLLEGPDPFGAPEVGNARRGADTRPRMDHCVGYTKTWKQL